MSYRFLAAAFLLAASLAAQSKGDPKSTGRTSRSPRSLDQRHHHAYGTAEGFAAKPTLNDAEAVAYEKAQAKELNDQDGQSDGPLIAAAGSSGTGGYNVLFIDRGTELARVDGVKRTSLIIDPPDGRIPPMTRGRRVRGFRP